MQDVMNVNQKEYNDEKLGEPEDMADERVFVVVEFILAIFKTFD